MPALLFAVADAARDVDAFKRAEHALWGNVFHQGTRWAATAKTVPFFAELLMGAELPAARLFLVTYLHHLAVGYPHSLFPAHFPLADFEAEASALTAMGLPQAALDGDVFNEDGEAPNEQVEAVSHRMTALWERDAYLAVEAQLDAVAPLASDDDEAVALEALALVSSFPRKRAALIHALWAISRAERFQGRRGAALLALARLGERVDEAARVLMDADDGLDGLYAACAEIIGSEQPSEIARRRPLGLSPERGQVDCPFAGSVSALVSVCIERAPPSEPREAMTALIGLLERAPEFQKPRFLDKVLALSFSRPISTGVALDELQRRAVEAALTHGMWRPNHSFLNQDEVLRAHGLPTNRAALSSLLG